MPVVPAGESVYLWVYPQKPNSTTAVNISNFNDTDDAKRPFLLTTFDDKIPAHPTLEIKPYEEDGFLPHFTWDSKEDDLWYGILHIDNSQINNQYHNFLYYIPFNENLTGYAGTQYAGNVFLEGTDGGRTSATSYDFTAECSISAAPDVNSTWVYLNEDDDSTAEIRAKFGDGLRVFGEGIADYSYVKIDSHAGGSGGKFQLMDEDGAAVSATKTVGTLYSGEGHTISFGGTVDDRFDGLAGHSKKFLNQKQNVLSWPGAKSGVGAGTHFSFLTHIIPDRGTLSEDTYIAFQDSTVDNDIDYSWYLSLTMQGQIKLSVQGRYNGTNTNLVTELISSSIIPRDNESPTMICWTLDNEIVGGNVKLFINGILEASSGLLSTGNSNSSNQWGDDVTIDTANGPLYIGGRDENRTVDSGTNPEIKRGVFSGKIEETVAYDSVIYPVNPRDGSFVWRKPVKDFTGDKATPLSYVARLFIKDYHNIRGRSTSDVAVSPPISYMKPILGIRGD